MQEYHVRPGINMAVSPLIKVMGTTSYYVLAKRCLSLLVLQVLSPDFWYSLWNSEKQ